MQLSVLTLIIALPLLTGIVILLLPEGEKKAPRVLALISGLITLLLSGWAYFRYDISANGYQFVQRFDWLPALGISYYVGVDGISLPMVLLSAIVVTSGAAISWHIDERPREFFSYLMFLAASVFGVFCSLDLFMLFFFFELAVFPKYLMILIWGSPKTREYGAMKLTLYLFLGSMVALVGVLAMVFASGANTFDMLALERAGFSAEFQHLWFPFVFVGFAILGGMFPFHSWAPDGHVAAPTAVSMLLAGVEMKVGVFAALRVAIMLFPQGAKDWAVIILILGTINVVYGALIAMIQTDFKYVIGFSSVSHMGLVLIGFASLNREGLMGAGVQMFSHGVMTALFFAVVGMVYDRTHTRDISQLGGLFKIMPLAALGFIVSGLVSMGMPGFSGFVAEFPIFMGAWRVAPAVAIIAVLGIIVTAGYILLVLRRVFFGEMPDGLSETVGDVSLLDKSVIVFLSLIMIAIGLFPSLIVPMVNSGVDRILLLLGGR
ncbi:NADH dehydrogenase subunit M [Leptolinea sp. HRD-7]|jgi:NADH-quinone oxidoreductase subunit M|nr:NADH dehydrogenase subunit M [Leptolinea sp. HRD-7]